MTQAINLPEMGEIIIPEPVPNLSPGDEYQGAIQEVFNGLRETIDLADRSGGTGGATLDTLVEADMSQSVYFVRKTALTHLMGELGVLNAFYEEEPEDIMFAGKIVGWKLLLPIPSRPSVLEVTTRGTKPKEEFVYFSRWAA